MVSVLRCAKFPTCKMNRKHERLSTSIWIAFTLQSRCGIGLRCGANLSAWAARVSDAGF